MGAVERVTAQGQWVLLSSQRNPQISGLQFPNEDSRAAKQMQGSALRSGHSAMAMLLDSQPYWLADEGPDGAIYVLSQQSGLCWEGRGKGASI